MNQLLTFFKEHKLLSSGLLMLLGMGTAMAGAATGIGDFSGMWQDIIGTLSGDVGKILIALAAAWGIAQVVQQNWLQVIGAFLAALILVNLETLIDGIFTSALPVIV